MRRVARDALDKLLPMQRGDFEGIFRAMDGLPVTVRLLDPPLHEFLPQSEEDIRAVADALGRSIGDVRHGLESLHEFNRCSAIVAVDSASRSRRSTRCRSARSPKRP